MRAISHRDRKYPADEVTGQRVGKSDAAKVVVCFRVCRLTRSVELDVRLGAAKRRIEHVVLNTAFGERAMAVDTHIFRVANRTGIAPGKNVLEVEKALLKFVPEEYLLDAHHWLILHGRYICVARKPRCGSCPIVDLCEYKHKELDNKVMPTDKLPDPG